VIVCFTQTSPSPITRGVNPAATLVGANKHLCRRRLLCQPSGEAKERQQAFSGAVAGEAIGIRYRLNIVVELSRFSEPLFKRVYPCSTLVYAE
jgi:hypothetical protein